MKKLFSSALLLCIVLLFYSPTLRAQVVNLDTTTFWKKKTSFGLNLNQASFSSNWKGGGVNSIGFNGLFNFKANYNKDKTKWENELDLQYGFVNNEGQGFRKTLDRLYFNSNYGYKISPKWDLFSSLNFLSQFAKGFKYTTNSTGQEVEQLISDLFAPAFITSAWGATYQPVSYFKVGISPFAPRVTIVQDPTRFTQSVGPSPYGVDSTSTTRFEWLAFQLTAEFDKTIATNVNLKWRYQLFANYETLSAETIDHRLDLILTAKVNKHLNVTLGGIILYDVDQDSDVQLSQLFNFGFAYSIQNYLDKK